MRAVASRRPDVPVGGEVGRDISGERIVSICVGAERNHKQASIVLNLFLWVTAMLHDKMSVYQYRRVTTSHRLVLTGA